MEQHLQFSLKRALISTALIAIGCFGISLATRWQEMDGPVRFLSETLFYSSPMLFGTGVGLLFKKMGGGNLDGFTRGSDRWIVLFAGVRSVNTKSN
jgi:hypothetical protein